MQTQGCSFWALMCSRSRPAQLMLWVRDFYKVLTGIPLFHYLSVEMRIECTDKKTMKFFTNIILPIQLLFHFRLQGRTKCNFMTQLSRLLRPIGLLFLACLNQSEIFNMNLYVTLTGISIIVSSHR